MRSCARGARHVRHATLEVVMPRIHATAAAALLLALGCSSVFAGDFMPRASNGFAAVGDDAPARTRCPDVGSSAPMSEDSPSHTSPGAAASPSASPLRSAKHIGIDDLANDAH